MPENWHYDYYKTQTPKTQTAENWLSNARLYINCYSIKTIRPTEKLFIHNEIPIPMMELAKPSVKRQVARKPSKGEVSSF